MSKTLVTFRLIDGHEMERGETVTNFRDESGIFEHATRGNWVGGDGKVMVSGREYFARGWGLNVIELAECGCPSQQIADAGHQEGCEHAHRQPRQVRVTRRD